MTAVIIAGATALLSATYVFYVRPALDEREIRREMSNGRGDTSPA